MTRKTQKTSTWAFLSVLGLLFCCDVSEVAQAQDQQEEAAPVRIETVRIETKNYEIDFSTKEMSPNQWNFLLPSAQNDLQPRQRFAMVDREVVEVLQHRPLRFRLDLANTAAETSQKDGVKIVRFQGQLVARNLKVIQTYRIPHDGFVSTLSLSLVNEGSAAQSFDEGVCLSLGAGLGSPEQPLLTQAFVSIEGQGTSNVDPPEDDLLESLGPLQWAGLQSRYYSLALIPKGQTRIGESRVVLDSGLADSGVIEQSKLAGFPSLELWSEPFTLPPGKSKELEFTLYAGPKNRQLLREAQVGLEDSVYCHLWRWLAALCVLLESVLAALYSALGSWGVAILIVAIGVRVCMLPLSRYGIREQQDFQQKQEQVKPLLAEIKKKYKGDILKVNDETLRIYKEHGISSLAPLKGSLPLLIQLPILFAFYQLLSNSYDLKGVPFLWIQDLSLPDRLFSLGVNLPLLGDAVNVLPIIMFACHVMIASGMTKTSLDQPKKHNLSSYFLPLMMLVLFYSFPAGCMLYWTVGSIFQVFEQRAMGPTTGQSTMGQSTSTPNRAPSKANDEQLSK